MHQDHFPFSLLTYLHSQDLFLLNDNDRKSPQIIRICSVDFQIIGTNQTTTRKKKMEKITEIIDFI